VFEDLEVDRTSPLGALLDRVLRKVNVHGLVDYYLGCTADYKAKGLTLYFSESAPEDTLKALEGDVGDPSYTTQLKKTSVEGAGWSLAVSSAPEQEQPTEVPLSGKVGLQVSLQGTVDVRS